MPPPPVANVQLRAKINKKINRSTSAWKTLSLGRRDKVKNDSAQIFRSPSIYENEENREEENVMKKYLSGKIVPLTPSQQPTNVEHLVQKTPEKSNEKQTNSTVVNNSMALDTMANYCAIM